MAKSKKSKILAMTLCAGVMAGIYASPVMAADIKVEEGSTLKGVTPSTSTDYTITSGTLKLDGADIANALNGKNINLGTGSLIINNQNIGNSVAAIRRVVNKDTGMSATYLEKTVKAHSAFGLQVLDEDGKAVATISRNGTGEFNGPLTANKSLTALDVDSKTKSVLGVSGVQLYNSDGTNKVNITNSGASRFGSFDETNVRIEGGALKIMAANNAAVSGPLVAQLSEDGLTLVDADRKYSTLTAAQLANLNSTIKEGGVVDANELNVSGATGGLYIKDVTNEDSETGTMIFAGPSQDGDSTLRIDPKNGNLSTKGTIGVADNNWHTVTQIQGSGENIGDIAVGIQYDGDGNITGQNIVLDASTGDVISKGDVTTLNDDGTVNYSLNTIGANTAGIERIQNGAGNNITEIENTLRIYDNGTISTVNSAFRINKQGNVFANAVNVADGTVVISENSINAFDSKFTVNKNGGVSTTGIKVAEGMFTASAGGVTMANNNLSVDLKGNIKAGTYNGVKIGMNEDGDIILGDGTVIDDNFNSDNVAGITRKPLDDSAPGRGNTTTIEGATSFTKDGMTTNGLSVEGTYGGFHVKDVSYNGKNNTMIYTTDKNGKETLFIDTQNGNLVSQGSLNVAGGRFIVDKDTGNMSVNAADGSAVFHVNGNDGTVHVGKVGGAQTVITGNSITTETLNVEKIVLGDKIVDKDTGDVIGGELEIGADGSVKIDNADTDAVEFNATKTALSANYGGTSLNMDSNGFNLNNGTGIDAESFVLNADGFAFKGSLNLGAGSDVKYTGGNYGTLAKLDATVKDIYDRTDGIYKDGEGNTVISNETGKWNDTTQKTEYTGEGSKVVVGDNGTTFENGAGNGTTNIDGSKITSDANGTISGGSGSSTNSIENPFGSSTSNGEETVYDGENGNTNTVNSSGMTVTNGTSTTVIDAEKVDTTTGNFSNKVTVGSEGNQTVITGGDVTVDNSVTVGGADGTSINHDEVRVGGEGGSYMNDTDVVSGEGVSLNDTAERVGHLENRVGELEDRIDKVGAMAAAIANLRTMGYDPAAPTEVAVGIGQYRDETGAALGLFHYPNRDFMLSLSVSTSGDEVMGGIGATWKFGRKSPEKVAEIKKAQAEADVRRAEEAKLAKAEEMKQAAKEAKIKAQQERHAKLAAERAAQAEAAK